MLGSARDKLDSWTLIGVFGLVYFLSQTVIAVLVHPLGSNFLAAQTTLSADRVREILGEWRRADLLQVYVAHYRFDMIHPFWYGTFLSAMLAKGFNANQVSPRFNAVLLLPFVAAACDLTENLMHLSFLADRENITESRVIFGNGAALLKWALAFACTMTVAGLTVRRIVRGPRATAAGG